MKFYDREQEIEKLQEIARRSREVAQFTVVTGRRRVGKSSLILKAYEKESFAYLFVERKSEKDLCEGFDKEYGFYFSVLSAIACGRNTRAEKSKPSNPQM